MSGNMIYANDSGSERPKLSEKSTSVTFENMNVGAMLYVKDSEDHILYSEEITSEGFITRGFDLSGLPVDEYYFEIDKEDHITLFPFSVEKSTVTLRHDLKENIVKPQVKLDGDRVVVSRDIDENQSLEISIYYEGEGLVFNEKLDRDGKLMRRYDLSTSESGTYLFSIEIDNRVYSEIVEI